MINDLGVDPNEWFDDRFVNPLDSMPIATYVENDGSTGPLIPPPERKDFPPELMEVPTSVKNPKPEKKVEVVETIHHKMYAVATAKYNPFSVGGSESIHDFEGGSENCQQ
tara:strand:+ start:192 stop:521 length:330 start_codon:yes stop_codon:yes gene_type:complete